MQKRHNDRRQYFNELARTSEKHLLPYIRKNLDTSKPLSVLEIGCGDGGNLLPFARLGHQVTGIDISSGRIYGAVKYFKEENTDAKFICGDILNSDFLTAPYDLLICHDVIEHINDKPKLLTRIESLLKPGATLFIAFPAWQMPFGGHQQICCSPWLSKLPFIHLMPRRLYKMLLTLGGENPDCIKELISIKASKLTIEHFEKLIAQTSLLITDKRLYLINPHYETKFGLKPRRLPGPISRIPYLRNFMTTSCFYLIQKPR